MNDRRNGKLKENAQNLRKNMTKEERHLWYDFLKTLPLTVKRQKPIGPYIVDFYIASVNLVIELDGSQHYEDNAKEKDVDRDKYFSEMGLNVLRFSNLDVNRNFQGICEEILKYL